MAQTNGPVANGTANNAVVAVGEVRDALPAPDLSDLTISSQTLPVGLIHPPPDIRNILEKTASFVAKNGLEFEKRILANERENVKFNFLKSTDPYHAYYRHRVEEHQKGEVAEPAAAAVTDQAARDAAAAATALPTPAVPPTKPLEKPEDEQYTVHVPEGLRLQDLDLIKLTAQFVARNGKGFLTELAMKEARNMEFNFLKPTHSLFTFFTGLCDAYSRVLMPPAGTMDRLRSNAEDRAAILERCLKRLEWEKVQHTEAKRIADAKEAERLAMQSIDWHDFVVVETIDFYEDEEDELPAPLTLRDVQALNKAAPFDEDVAEEEEEHAEAGGKGEDVAMEMDEDERKMVEEANATEDADAAPEVDVDAAKPPADEEEEEEMLVVENYQRQAPRPSAAAAKMVVSPITGEMIPVDQMAEHMRISLIDPRWKQQREAMLAKIRDTTKASDDEINRNLMGLARSRPDVFGSTQEEVSQIVSDSLRDANISGTDRPVAWDGATKGGQDLRNQVAAIQQQRTDAATKAPPPLAALPPPPIRPASGPQPPTGQLASLPPAPRPGPAVQLPPPPVQPSASRAPPMGMPPPSRPPMPGMPPPMMSSIPRPMPPPPAPMMPRPPAMVPPPPRPPSSGPPLPPGAAPPPLPEEPAAKRQRVSDFVLQPEDEFLAAHPGSYKIQVLVPDVEDNAALNGQILEVEVASLTDQVGAFKARLAEVLSLAANRLQLSREGVGFLKDQFSLAFSNVSSDTKLQLSIRQRGGRR